MNVRILHHPTIKPGTIIDVSEEEAAQHVRTGRGEFVEDAPMPVLETATVAPPENAAVRTTRPVGRPRKA